jgi:heptosyltransferase II
MVEHPKLGSRILLRSPNWLGDAVMTLPAVQYLRHTLPSTTQVSILCPAKLCHFWQLVPHLHAVLIADDNIAITADILKPHTFDTAILFPNSLRSALEVWLARIPLRHGYKGHHRRWLLNSLGSKPSRDLGYRHQKWDYLDLILHLTEKTLNPPNAEPLFTPLPRPSTHSLPFPQPYLAVCPGAEYGAAKRWPIERYAETLQQLYATYSLPIVLLGSNVDIPVAQALTEKLQLPANSLHNLSGKTSLSEFLHYIAHAQLLLCNDSGSMHVAAAFGTKAVSIFGSTEPKLTGPITDSVSVLRHHVPCSPCFLRECPIDFRCMNAVTVPDVLSACARLL